MLVRRLALILLPFLLIIGFIKIQLVVQESLRMVLEWVWFSNVSLIVKSKSTGERFKVGFEDQVKSRTIVSTRVKSVRFNNVFFPEWAGSNCH